MILLVAVGGSLLMFLQHKQHQQQPHQHHNGGGMTSWPRQLADCSSAALRLVLVVLVMWCTTCLFALLLLPSLAGH